MGQKLTKSACVNLRDLPPEVYAELTSETYTVIRTGGWEQQGWRIPTEPHDDCEFDVMDGFMHGLACNRLNPSGYLVDLDGERFPWKVYMVFVGEDSTIENKKHACGWRRSAPGKRTFWPTRLDGNADGQEAWGLRLDGLLNSLKTPDDCEATEAERPRNLEAKYKEDEIARQAAAKALQENPVATPAMMAEMRQRESTGARCLRNNTISIPVGENFALKIKDLEAISVHDANRLRRLFDSGCPKAIVFWLAEFHNYHANRNQFITEEEAKLFLEPLAEPCA
jgi:hypothetical protein